MKIEKLQKINKLENFKIENESNFVDFVEKNIRENMSAYDIIRILSPVSYILEVKHIDNHIYVYILSKSRKKLGAVKFNSEFKFINIYSI